MDNLFVLGLNADDNVRTEYLAEIKKELLGFARSYNNGLGNYLEELLIFVHKDGFLTELKAQLTSYQQANQ